MNRKRTNITRGLRRIYVIYAIIITLAYVTPLPKDVAPLAQSWDEWMSNGYREWNAKALAPELDALDQQDQQLITAYYERQTASDPKWKTNPPALSSSTTGKDQATKMNETRDDADVTNSDGTVSPSWAEISATLQAINNQMTPHDIRQATMHIIDRTVRWHARRDVFGYFQFVMFYCMDRGPSIAGLLLCPLAVFFVVSWVYRGFEADDLRH